MTPLFIAIEGPIGVGKSSLTKKLADTLNLAPIYEIVEENPFLSDFYEDISKWSFQTEMFFLCNRYKVLTDLSEEASVISDYHILKNKVFANNTLNQKEYKMFEEIYDILTREVRTPDITVFLTADLEVLKHRIQLRNRDFESYIEDDYLIKLTEDYHRVYESMKDDHNTILINTSDIDFVQNEEDYTKIVKQIKEMIGA
ncbi:deoxynucleoside kinase [Macrococcus armenti]|uniref:deoxynucleoside kinase n=1 Tax=Macrococcus armenti TaxID=2875764 RepID=UPI001CCDC689|nr:deoxynucleoside kinase [Macrococcus armenti]UBH08490.1 deoxynucleoside kinase [Macrococcus armenti]UBH10776.1 deoxynucleoside kinase [Macrococcus armenti]UBH15257.1 deoxynucleoside kinase [Macrococcus armenti]UBH17615.1 deoxynucleoside kinase [Macrococcus armenti]UBH19881.1 deoxynucleoside kinase [Macrococcus armenti]